MTKIFLSYAEEDQSIGQGLARALVDQEFTVYWWEDPALPRRRFQEDIEQRIYDADQFIAVLSDDYLRSPWCRRERNMAIHLESGGREGFIAVVEASSAVNRLWPGLLSEYVRIPVQPADWNATVNNLASTIGPSTIGGGAQSSTNPVTPRSGGSMPKFRNRDEELDLIVDQLTIEGGIDVWLVSAPPQLGKSWFLDELGERVRRQVQDCRVSVLDVKEARSVLRGDPVRLLKHMLELETPLPEPGAELGDSDLNRMAAEISRRRRPQLYMLDSADLLEGEAPTRLRTYLDEVFRRLSSSGSNTRLRVVISGRRVDRWRPMTNVRSKKLRLTEFTDVVVRAALSDLAGQHHNLGAERLDALTRRLHRLCEGLPALLVETLERIDEHQFVGIDGDEWWQEAFVEVVRPYVADHVLSTDSLFPAGGRDLNQSKALIEVGLKALVPYRMVTRSHLVFLAEHNAELRGLGSSELFEILPETALVLPVQGSPWYEIYPPIRRLLYRYYITDGADQETVHRLARQYYRSFCSRQHTGSEQPVRLIECIWHEAMRRSAARSTSRSTDQSTGRSTGIAIERLDDLPDYAAAATREFLLGSTYSSLELDRFTAELLDDDLELQYALSDEAGLFEALRGSIQSVIQGGGA